MKLLKTMIVVAALALAIRAVNADENHFDFENDADRAVDHLYVEPHPQSSRFIWGYDVLRPEDPFQPGSCVYVRWSSDCPGLYDIQVVFSDGSSWTFEQ